MAEIRVMRQDLLPPKEPPRRHLISIGDLERHDVERLLGTARSFERSLERELKKLPTLRGKTVVNVFYESSTRTSSSFESRTTGCACCGASRPRTWTSSL